MNQPTPLTELQITTLLQPLKPHRVASRSQGNRSLSYLQAWDVKAMLIRVFGFAGFSAECINTQVIDISAAKNNAANHQVTVMCTVRLTIHQTGAVYTESAAAMQTGPQLGEVTDFAIKTAESDALKRAAINLGTQFGLSLYDNGSLNDVVVAIVAPGQERRPDGTMSPEQAEQAQSSLGMRTVDPATEPPLINEPEAEKYNHEEMGQ